MKTDVKNQFTGIAPLIPGQDFEVSISPNGEEFVLPDAQGYERELARLKKICAEQSLKGRQIVVVMGVGFVGAVMAGVVADAWDAAKEDSPYFVIGMQRPSTRSYWKIPYLNRGQTPVEAEDPEVAPLISRCVLDKQTLIASFSYDALSMADIVVVDGSATILRNFWAVFIRARWISGPWKKA